MNFVARRCGILIGSAMGGTGLQTSLDNMDKLLKDRTSSFGDLSSCGGSPRFAWFCPCRERRSRLFLSRAMLSDDLIFPVSYWFFGDSTEMPSGTLWSTCQEASLPLISVFKAHMLAIRVRLRSMPAVPCVLTSIALPNSLATDVKPVLRTELCSGHSVQRPRNVVVWTVLLAFQLSL